MKTGPRVAQAPSPVQSREAGVGAPHVRCIGCRRISEDVAADFRCRECGELFEVVYDRLDADEARVQTGDSPAHRGAGVPAGQKLASDLKSRWLDRKLSHGPSDQSGVWRFRDVLPILDDPAHAVTMREGNTPVWTLPRSARSAGVDQLLAKHQGMNPTGSFKDTGMTTALSVANERGFAWVGCASTGNTSASMAAYAARAGMNALVLIPDGKIAWSKLSQSLDYGAVTLQLRTDFDGCVRVLLDIVKRFPLYLLNSMNPYRLEGQKTAAYELMEQLEWRVPDHVIVPGGNLANSSALGKGFLEMRALGLIDRLPKLSIIQAEGANPLVRSLREHGGEKLDPVKAETRATAIRIGNPASWKKAIGILRATGGSCEQVSEVEIAQAKAEIGADGIGCEPASATTLAGLKKLVRSGAVRASESVVLILTGHVLKDPDYTLDFHRAGLELALPADAERLRRPPQVLDADVDAVIRVLEQVK
jgi:threonine synthase